MSDNTLKRPYLVIPKLIEQPTWGGTYIVETKKWQDKPALVGRKIGQSYELYEKSNLSFASDSRDPVFSGELADNKSVETQSNVENSTPLAALVAQDPVAVLGKKNVDTYGPSMHLLLKFTQALGNSYQIHIPDGVDHKRWRPKPESWYYFEPGLITCGVRPNVDWQEYHKVVSEIDRQVGKLASRVRDGSLSYDAAKASANALIAKNNPEQFVNVLRVEAGQLLDLSPCGIHHSWEEDLATIPLGNVLYEIQLNRLDDESTIRSFDKGKITPEGKVRPLQIEDYFALIDRSAGANDPQTHLRKATLMSDSGKTRIERILETKYYTMDRVNLTTAGSEYIDRIDTFRHLFVRSGSIMLVSGNHEISVSAGHAAFIPAGSVEYAIRANNGSSEVLISS